MMSGSSQTDSRQHEQGHPRPMTARSSCRPAGEGRTNCRESRGRTAGPPPRPRPPCSAPLGDENWEVRVYAAESLMQARDNQEPRGGKAPAGRSPLPLPETRLIHSRRRNGDGSEIPQKQRNRGASSLLDCPRLVRLVVSSPPPDRTRGLELPEGGRPGRLRDGRPPFPAWSAKIT